METPSICNSLKIVALFHISSTTALYTYFVCEFNSRCDLKLPSNWKLFCDDNYIQDITLSGFVLDNSTTHNHTLYASGHIDKSLFDFSKSMEFKNMNTLINN